MKTPVNVAITGAAGQIGYALAFRVASGQMLGPDQPVNLHLLEITPALGALQGVMMELNDCAFPTLNRIVATDDAKVAFRDCHAALLVGARPRGPGMERKDLLLANAQIFSAQGKALDAVADRNVRVLVVGNPANTNSLIAMKNAPSLDPKRFTAMVRLDHNRALSQLAEKTGTHVTDLRKVIIWGNHSATQYPDLHHATVAGKPALSLVDQAWYADTFIPVVQQRGRELHLKQRLARERPGGVAEQQVHAVRQQGGKALRCAQRHEFHALHIAEDCSRHRAAEIDVEAGPVALVVADRAARQGLVDAAQHVAAPDRPLQGLGVVTLIGDGAGRDRDCDRQPDEEAASECP